ncbi:branched-chain amino acid ABC transporter permease [Prochlorococcus sp. AH-716-E13]|nr:branched-chain amino acid ABC transporter permease [Prochlorococcus sp. AH-716-E13]
MELLLDSLFNGVAIGSVLLVAALGLAIVFGLMGVINLAHGELMMLGAYTTYVTQLIFKLPLLKPYYNAYVIVSIFFAFIVSGVVGILLEKTVIRKLYGSPLETLLATWGVSLILQQFVRSVPLAYGTGLVISLMIGLFLPSAFSSKVKESINFKYIKFSSWIFAALAGVLSGNLISSSVSKLSRASARNVDVTAPAWMRGQVEILGTAFPKTRLMIIIITLISVIAISLFLNQSAWGMRIRAVTQNREMCDCLGISTEKVDVLTFGIGSGLAGVAGVAVSLLGSVGPNVGGNYIVGCFMVVVLGGVGNLLGTILASFGIGIMTDLIGAGRLLSIWPDMPLPISNTINFFATTSMARVMIFALIVIFLQFKPTGLFPQKGRMVEN